MPQIHVPPAGDELLTIREAMALLKCSRRTIYNFLQADKVTYVRTVGGGQLILRSSLFLTTDQGQAEAKQRSELRRERAFASHRVRDLIGRDAGIGARLAQSLPCNPRRDPITSDEAKS